MRQEEMTERRLDSLETVVSGIVGRLDAIREDVTVIKTKLANGIPGQAQACLRSDAAISELNMRVRTVERFHWQAMAIVGVVLVIIQVLGRLLASQHWLGG